MGEASSSGENCSRHGAYLRPADSSGCPICKREATLARSSIDPLLLAATAMLTWVYSPASGSRYVFRGVHAHDFATALRVILFTTAAVCSVALAARACVAGLPPRLRLSWAIALALSALGWLLMRGS
jgi:hypothetical protein